MNVKLIATTEPRELVTVEEFLISCARVSSPDNRLPHSTAPKLLSYLIKSKHWSPFEMVSACIEIETSRAIGAQLLRHKSFSFQEYSQRYAEVDTVEPIELRGQAIKNRQSSTVVIDDIELVKHVENHVQGCKWLYSLLLRHGVAKECARMVLPMATQTTIVMHGTLRSWIHFLDQRCDDHAQKEIRAIADEIKQQLSIVFPWTAKALEWV
jgi:thymidylate synthase (FAD)